MQIRPADALLVAFIQGDFQDLRLQHHLALHDQLGPSQVVLDQAQLLATGADHHQAGPRIDDHLAVSSDHHRQGALDILPEVRLGGGGDGGAH